MGSLIIVLLTTRSVAIPGAPHCRRWAEASGVATGARYAGTPVRLADKADVVKPPSAGEPLYCNAYLQVVSVKQALSGKVRPPIHEPLAEAASDDHRRALHVLDAEANARVVPELELGKVAR